MRIEAKEAIVKRRGYNAPYRQAEAQRHRKQILEAARKRFLTLGYAPTTLRAVASDAGVSVETIYKTFGNKGRLFKTVFDVELAGDDAAGSIAERPWVADMIAEPNPHRKMRMYAQWLAVAMSRAGTIQLVARAAASTDTEIDGIWKQMGAERLEGMGGFAGHLAAGAYLRNDLSVEQARDILWTYNSVEIYELLVIERGWTLDRYRDFIAAALSSALLP
jgi:AcrR family transcriptional regulator